jgi:hypothetical protein
MLDEALCEFERWAQGHAYDSVFYQERNDLTPAQRQAVLEQVAAARRALQSAQEAFDLRREVQPIRRAIASHCALMWEILAELEPARLRRYGALEEEAAECAGANVAELRRAIDALAEIVAWKPAGEKT